MQKLGKTVLVTGGSQGIGAAIATTFAAAGYDVAINCHSQRSLENGGHQTADACRACGVDAECFIADVSDYAACEQLVHAVTERFGAIDVLVNNAGTTRDGLLAQMSEEHYDSVIATNQKSVFNMTRHVCKGMIKRRSGKIINMASVAGVFGNPGQINYSASKAAIIGMTKTTAKELGKRGITCNAIAPGLIESPMTDQLNGEQKAKILSAISLGRFGKAQEVADVALFLASADYISGQTILVDGCLSM